MGSRTNHVSTRKRSVASGGMKPSFPLLGRMMAEQSPVSVLLAHADLEIRSVLADQLRRQGYRVSELWDGIDLLEWLAEALDQCSTDWRPDLIVADIRLRGWKGIDVLAGLRDAGWTTPFILLARPGDKRLIKEAERLGRVVVFEYPFASEDVGTAAPFMISRHGNQANVDCVPQIEERDEAGI